MCLPRNQLHLSGWKLVNNKFSVIRLHKIWGKKRYLTPDVCEDEINF